jgi:hypothetical protein
MAIRMITHSGEFGTDEQVRLTAFGRHLVEIGDEPRDVFRRRDEGHESDRPFRRRDKSRRDEHEG